MIEPQIAAQRNSNRSTTNYQSRSIPASADHSAEWKSDCQRTDCILLQAQLFSTQKPANSLIPIKQCSRYLGVQASVCMYMCARKPLGRNTEKEHVYFLARSQSKLFISLHDCNGLNYNLIFSVLLCQPKPVCHIQMTVLSFSVSYVVSVREPQYHRADHLN